MTYTHLTTDELVMIESYHHQAIPVAIIAERLKKTGPGESDFIHIAKIRNNGLKTIKAINDNTKSITRLTITYIVFFSPSTRIIQTTSYVAC